MRKIIHKIRDWWCGGDYVCPSAWQKRCENEKCPYHKKNEKSPEGRKIFFGKV